MIGDAKAFRSARGVVSLFCLFGAGCALVPPTPTAEPPVVTAPAPAAPVATVEPPAAIAPETASPPAPAAPEPPMALPAPPPPAVVAVTAAPAPPAEPRAMPAGIASQPVVTAPLDFASLGTRLRKAKTIGVWTKLAVKNEVETLLDRFRAYHQRQGTATLSELHSAYDTLLLKVSALFQDSDPPLARDIAESRGAIWDILADPRKFTETTLLAGAAR